MAKKILSGIDDKIKRVIIVAGNDRTKNGQWLAGVVYHKQGISIVLEKQDKCKNFFMKK